MSYKCAVLRYSWQRSPVNGCRAVESEMFYAFYKLHYEELKLIHNFTKLTRDFVRSSGELLFN